MEELESFRGRRWNARFVTASRAKDINLTQCPRAVSVDWKREKKERDRKKKRGGGHAWLLLAGGSMSLALLGSRKE